MTTDYQKIYEHLGYLFYSVAASDGKVREAEIGKLKELIDRYCLPLERSQDEFGTDAAHYISISFDHAHAENMGSAAAFDRFKVDMDEMPALRSDPLKSLVVETCWAIAGAFAGRNKSELVQISQLEQLLGTGAGTQIRSNGV